MPPNLHPPHGSSDRPRMAPTLLLAAPPCRLGWSGLRRSCESPARPRTCLPGAASPPTPRRGRRSRIARQGHGDHKLRRSWDRPRPVASCLHRVEKQVRHRRATRRLTFVSMKEGWLSSGGLWFGSLSFRGCWFWSDAHVSMASSLGGSGVIGCSLGRKSEKGGQAAGRKAAPRGANFSLRESMCQIALASLRARSTWATLAPRCLPSRRLVRWWRSE